MSRDLFYIKNKNHLGLPSFKKKKEKETLLATTVDGLGCSTTYKPTEKGYGAYSLGRRLGDRQRWTAISVGKKCLNTFHTYFLRYFLFVPTQQALLPLQTKKYYWTCLPACRYHRKTAASRSRSGAHSPINQQDGHRDNDRPGATGRPSSSSSGGGGRRHAKPFGTHGQLPLG